MMKFNPRIWFGIAFTCLIIYFFCIMDDVFGHYPGPLMGMVIVFTLPTIYAFVTGYFHWQEWRHNYQIQHLAEQAQLETAKANVVLTKITASRLPAQTALSHDVQEMLLKAAIAEGLPPEHVTAYRSQKITALIDVLVKRELAEIELKTLRGKTDIDLSAKEREARTKINMLELAARVKKSLDGHL
jgi:hypothetical protein